MLALLVAAGCGEEKTVLAPACTDSAGAIVTALEQAPGPVTLGDGTTLSRCVDQARSDVELQSLGMVLTSAAEQLAEQRRHAWPLGYLVGAAQRGSEHNSGVGAELVRRLESAGRRVGDGPRAAARAEGRERERMRLRLYHHRDGARVAYREAGTGPPLALLHSAVLSHREWEPVVEQLTERFRVVLPDLPLHGDSEDRPRHPYTPEWLAEVMAGFFRETCWAAAARRRPRRSAPSCCCAASRRARCRPAGSC